MAKKVIEVAGESDDPGRTAEAREQLLSFFGGLEERLHRIELKVDFANRMIDMLGSRLFGQQQQGAGIAPLDPATIRRGREAFRKATAVFNALFGK